jgi:hypothetical protein
MDVDNTAPGYHLWGIDNSAYGPVELPVLVNWIKDDRVLADSWLYVERESEWMKAVEVPELKMFFKPKANPACDGGGLSASAADIKPAALRRIKVLAEMTDDQLESLHRIMEVVLMPPFTRVVTRGEPSDAMYGVLEGELRSSIRVEGRECPIAHLPPGSIFGEISLFDKGPHTVDVVSNQESLVVKMTAAAVARICKEAPDAALAFFAGVLKATAGRVRTLTKRYEDSVQAANGAGVGVPKAA